MVIITLLCGSESWVTPYNYTNFHQRSLCTILNIHQIDFLINNDVLEKRGHASKIPATLGITRVHGHIHHLPCIILHDVLSDGHNKRGAP